MIISKFFKSRTKKRIQYLRKTKPKVVAETAKEQERQD